MENKFKTGKAHIFNPVPKNEKEADAYGNALAKSGNYPVGLGGCFCVGISGGCGLSCYVYLNGDCEEAQEMLPRIKDEGTNKDLKKHYELYGEEQNDD